MTILAEILEVKAQEVAQLKEKFSLEGKERSVPVRSFIDLCQKDEALKIIAEFKRASPSKGMINAELDPIEQAQLYEQLGASMVSVLTDQDFFRGSYADLVQIKQTINQPVLNKDFIIDEIQIDRAYLQGADVILLIAASLPKERLNQLYQYAAKYGLEVLFEVHNEDELKVAQGIGARLIGVNNRDLRTFEVDLGVTERLAKLIDHDREILVSESGMKTAEDVLRVKKAGAQAILVGETLMRSADLQQTFSEILK